MEYNKKCFWSELRYGSVFEIQYGEWKGGDGLHTVCVCLSLHVWRRISASRTGVSNSRPGGQIRPATSSDVALQELWKNIICLLYGYMPIYRSTLPINYISHNASQIWLFFSEQVFFSEFDLFSSKYYFFVRICLFLIRFLKIIL